MKDKFVTYSFVLVIGGFFLFNLFGKDETISTSERRTLKQFPKITWDSIVSKKAMNDFDQYALDQFVFRDVFRSMKAHTVFDILHMLDFNQYYVKDNIIFKSEYPTNENSIQQFISKLSDIQETYLQSNRVFYSIIPDKNYYMKDTSYLNVDYDRLYKLVIEGLPNMEWIDLRDVLSIDDYYKTDTHWRQENLGKVVSTIGSHMGFQINSTYQKHYYTPFYGVYYGQIALQLLPDELIYVTNDILDQVVVTNYEKNSVLYDTSKLDSMDPYDVFLSGSTPFVVLENPNQSNGKELILFRDSFGSSLVPLLIEAYSKITLVDIRYITLEQLEKLLTFQDQDVLFLYSTLLVNNSSSLKG